VSWIRGFAIVLVLAAAGCGGSVASPDAATQDAGPEPDATVVDATVDAMPEGPPATGMDITSAGGRAIGGNYTLDFEIGHPLDQGKAAGGTFVIEGGAAVKP